jgi:hypothetical protein
MSSKEALSNIGEKMEDPNNSEEDMEHLLNLSGKILDREIPFEEDDNSSSLSDLDFFNSSED